MQPGKYNLPPHTNNDAWEGIPRISTLVDGLPVNLTGGRVDMELRIKASAPAAVLSLSSADGEITIDGAGESFSIPRQVISVPAPGLYVYAIQITPADGLPLTILAGTWSITEDVARPAP